MVWCRNRKYTFSVALVNKNMFFKNMKYALRNESMWGGGNRNLVQINGAIYSETYRQPFLRVFWSILLFIFKKQIVPW